MTFVTTSRKAAPEVRALAKDLAFALDCPFRSRGKMGLLELLAIDTSFLIVSTDYSGMRIQVFSSGNAVAELVVRSVTCEERTGIMDKTVSVSDQSVYDMLEPYVRVALGRETGSTIRFDGTRRRRYLLGLAPVSR